MATARSSGPVVPSATRGDAAAPAAIASRVGVAMVTSPSNARRCDCATSALQSARNSERGLGHERLVERSDGRRTTQAARGFEGVEPWIGEVFDDADLLDAHAVDLFDLANHEVEGARASKLDGELVDRDAFAVLEHVDADDVAVDRADARRDETERARTVRQPHANEDVRPGIGHVGIVRRTMTAVFRESEDTVRLVHCAP